MSFPALKSPISIDVDALVEKRKHEILSRTAQLEQRHAESIARRKARDEERLPSLRSSVEKEAKRFQSILNGETPPYAVYDWLLMDTWSREEALFLAAGLEPADEKVRDFRIRIRDGRHYSNEIAGLRTLEGLALWEDHSDLLEDWPRLHVALDRVFAQRWEFAKKLWDSGEHPDRPSPHYVIAWAQRKGIVLPWLEWAKQHNLLELHIAGYARNANDEALGDTERASLQKQVALLAIALAEKSKRYKVGDAPNASQIAETVAEILDGLPDAKRRGLSSSAIRATIKAGLSHLLD